MFISILDAKLDACTQRMNIFKQDSNGREIAIAESDKDEALVPFVAPNLGSHVNFVQNMSQTQILAPNDNNLVPFYPCHPSQSSLPFLFQLGQNIPQLMDLGNEVGGSNHKMGRQQEDGSDRNQNSSSCCYNRNMQIMQPYSNVALQALSSPLQFDATLQTLSNRPGAPQGFVPNGYDDSNMLQARFLNYMQRRK